MSKIILLGAGHATFSTNATKWSFIFMSILFFAQSALTLIRGTEGLIDNVYLGITLIGGFYSIVVVVMVFSKSSRFAPKLKVDDACIELKTKLFKKSKKLNWLDIQAIDFKSFRIDIKTANTVEIFSYDCSSDVSVEIKDAIRTVAEMKNIEVIGG